MNGSDIIIRKAVQADMACLVELLAELFSIEEDFMINTELQKTGLDKLLNSRGSYVFVADIKGMIAGMCTLQILISTAEGGYVGLVEDIVVKNGYRHTGIGNKLLEYLEKNAADLGLLRLQLLADKNNIPALQFYDKLKWKKTGLICFRKV